MDPPTEAEVGISEFASDVPGFTGILKQRQSPARTTVNADVFCCNSKVRTYKGKQIE